jgi:membrane-associated phospholipid phosphatase
VFDMLRIDPKEFVALAAVNITLWIGGCAEPSHSPGGVGIHDRIARVEQSRMARPGSRSVLHRANGGAEYQRSDRSAWGDRVELADIGNESTEMTGPEPKLSTDPDAIRMARAPHASFRSTLKRDVQELPREIWRDTKRVYGNPVNLAILGGAYAGSLAIQETGPDDTVERHYDRHDRTFNSDWSDAFGAIGNPGTHFALAGAWYLAGQQGGDTKTYEVGKTLFSALAINGVTVMLGQTASWDKSPNGEWGTFPSGHTSSSFVVASVMHQAYGHAVGIPLYGVATLAGVQRLDSREHYMSDVVMGGVLGTLVGHSVASGRDPEIFGWKVLPYANPETGASGIAFMKTK